jgi:hypothetical protein
MTSPDDQSVISGQPLTSALGHITKTDLKHQKESAVQSHFKANAEAMAAWNADVEKNGWTSIEELEREYGLA